MTVTSSIIEVRLTDDVWKASWKTLEKLGEKPSSSAWVGSTEKGLHAVNWLSFGNSTLDEKTYNLIERTVKLCVENRALYRKENIRGSLSIVMPIHRRNQRLATALENIRKTYFASPLKISDPSYNIQYRLTQLKESTESNLSLVQGDIVSLCENGEVAFRESAHLIQRQNVADPRSKAYRHNLNFLNSLGRGRADDADLIDRSGKELCTAWTLRGSKVGGSTIHDTVPLLDTTWNTLQFQIRDAFRAAKVGCIRLGNDLGEAYSFKEPETSASLRDKIDTLLALLETRHYVALALLRTLRFYIQRWQSDPNHRGLPEFRNLVLNAASDFDHVVPIDRLETLISSSKEHMIHQHKGELEQRLASLKALIGGQDSEIKTYVIRGY